MSNGDRTCPGCGGSAAPTSPLSTATSASPTAVAPSTSPVSASTYQKYSAAAAPVSRATIDGIKSAMTAMGVMQPDAPAPRTAVAYSPAAPASTQPFDYGVRYAPSSITPPPMRMPPAPQMFFLSQAMFDLRQAPHVSARTRAALEGLTLGELGLVTGPRRQDAPVGAAGRDCIRRASNWLWHYGEAYKSHGGDSGNPPSKEQKKIMDQMVADLTATFERMAEKADSWEQKNPGSPIPWAPKERALLDGMRDIFAAFGGNVDDQGANAISGLFTTHNTQVFGRQDEIPVARKTVSSHLADTMPVAKESFRRLAPFNPTGMDDEEVEKAFSPIRAEMLVISECIGELLR